MPLPLFEWPGRHPTRLARPRTAAERCRIEQILAIARLILACVAVAAVFMLPQTTGPDGVPGRILVLVYALQSAAVAAIVQYPTSPLSSRPILLHASDVIWAATLTTVTDGPGSPLYVLFLFPLVGAAYRWGFRETILTGGAALALFAAEAVLPRVANAIGAGGAGFNLQDVVIRGTYILTGAIVLGYVAEEDQLHHAEAAIISGLLARVQGETGFRAALRHVVGELLEVFEAKRLIFVAIDPDSGRAIWWEARPDKTQPSLALEAGKLDDERNEALQFAAPGDAVRLVRHDPSCTALAFDKEGGLLGHLPCPVSLTWWKWADARAVTLVNVRFDNHWAGRVLMSLDRVPALAEVRLFQRIVCHVTPVMYSHYLVRRLRSRVAATERLRVARELHDGVVQSLAGLEMHVAALRRRHGCELRALGLDDDMTRLQQVLGEETRSVRDVMHQIRPLDIGHGQIVRVFADLVSRFERDSGISARFSVDVDVDGTLVPSATARELGRTLQEALRNVRKHGFARHVDVRFTTEGGSWKLIVENDGVPFDFIGRMTLDDLEAQHKGPRVIKERVREMGGDLAIYSTPDHGVRLEITVPHEQRAHAHV